MESNVLQCQHFILFHAFFGICIIKQDTQMYVSTHTLSLEKERFFYLQLLLDQHQLPSAASISHTPNDPSSLPKPVGWFHTAKTFITFYRIVLCI